MEQPLLSSRYLDFGRNVSQQAGRVTGNNRPGSHIMGYHATGSHDSLLADYNVRQNRGAGADRGTSLDEGLRHRPVTFGLQASAGVRGPGINVINKRHPVPDENIVLNGDTLTNKTVTGDLAVISDLGVLLDFDEGADFHVIAHFTAIQVDELRELDAFTQLDIGRDADILQS